MPLFSMLTWDNISPDAKYQAYVSANGIDGASDFPRFLRKSGALLGCPPAVLTRAEEQQSGQVPAAVFACMSCPALSQPHHWCTLIYPRKMPAWQRPSSPPHPLSNFLFARPGGSPLDPPPLSRLHAALRMNQRLAQCAVASLSWIPPTCLG